MDVDAFIADQNKPPPDPANPNNPLPPVGANPAEEVAVKHLTHIQRLTFIPIGVQMDRSKNKSVSTSSNSPLLAKVSDSDLSERAQGRSRNVRVI